MTSRVLSLTAAALVVFVIINFILIFSLSQKSFDLFFVRPPTRVSFVSCVPKNQQQ